MAVRGHLRQVGHAQHLPGPRQGAQLAADDLRHRAADAGVHLVEDHGRHRVRAQRGHLDGQGDARQLAAGGDLAQRPRRLAGIGRHQELHPLGAVGVRARLADRLQLHQEAAAAHAQLADQGGGGLAQRLRGGLAGGGEGRGGLAPGLGGAGDLAVQLFQALAGAAQGVQLGGDAVAVRGQLGRGGAVLARQVVDPAQAALQLLVAGRVQVQVVADPAQLGQRLLDLHRGALQQLVHLEQARLVRGGAGQAVAHLLQPLRQRRAVLAAEPGQGLVAGGDQAGGVGLAAVGGVQRLQRGRVQFLALQLGQLVLQPGDAVGHVAPGLQPFALGQQRLPGRGGRAHGRALGLVAGVGVEQGQLAGAGEQGLVLVLAVDLHQHSGQLGQLRQGHRTAVDPGPRAAVGADHPPQLALAVLVQLVGGQPGQGGGVRGQGELGGQLGPLAAVADHPAVGAQAGQEAQGVHQQGLAGAGLAGNDGHARAEFQFGGAYYGEVADGEVSEHGRYCRGRPSRPRRPGERAAAGRIAAARGRHYLLVHEHPAADPGPACPPAPADPDRPLHP